MPSLLDLPQRAGPRRLRIETVTRLRWLAIGGQTLTIAVASLVLGLEVPLVPCALMIALSIWLNIVLRIRFQSSARLSETHAVLMLGFDVAQLAGLLYFTGGLENPFAVLLLVPVVVAATALTLRSTTMLGAFALVCASILAFDHWPLPWHPGEALDLPELYKWGIWLGLMSGLAFMAVYAWRVSQDDRSLSEAITATELALARESHLSALDGLAAAAAHALGTPLSTIAVVVGELEKSAAPDSPNLEDIQLLKAQTNRCRDILGRLASLRMDPDNLPFERITIAQFVEEVARPYRNAGITISVVLQAGEKEGREQPKILRNPAVGHSLGNIVENAVGFAESQVVLTAYWDARILAIEVADDGPGIPPDVMDHLGDPYVTEHIERRSGSRHADDGAQTDGGERTGEHEGLGLGFFIAKTILERTGASLRIGNRGPVKTDKNMDKNAQHGAVIRVIWPRHALDMPRQEPDSAESQEIAATPDSSLAKNTL
ncbi:MAG: ActS/PrrB/RegB family redox-sensitive histidine kinase [Pseudomonadota bacterium]